MKRVAIYAGTFDPITIGHLDIIKRALNLFDEVVIAVAESKAKKPMFDFSKRVELIKKATASLSNVEVIGFRGLLVDLTNELNSNIVIRGVRNSEDFEYELQLHYANRSLKDSFETIYLAPTLNHSYVSSSLVRTLLSHNGDISHLVPKEIVEDLKNVCSN
jgi:pantetheine-phosphate adenylyltransferase